MAICKNCGTESEGAKFCPECGTPIESHAAPAEGAQAPVPAPQMPKRDPEQAPVEKAKRKFAALPKWARVTLVAFGVLFILSAFGSCMGGGEEGKSQSADPAAKVAEDTAAQQEEKQKQQEEEAAKKLATAKDGLQKAIDAHQGKDSAAYTEDTFAALTSAIDAGKTLIDDPNATEAKVNAAAKAINVAAEGLKEAFNPANYQWPAYADVARNPDAYKGQKIAFSGKVLQVVDGDKEVNIRVATDGEWGDIVFAGYDPSMIDFRILEEDKVNIYGTCIGLYSYTSTMGAKISVPGIYLDSIELQ